MGTTKGGYVLRPDGGHVGLTPELPATGNVTVTLPYAAPRPAGGWAINRLPESGSETSDAAFTLAEMPPLVAIRYRPMTGDPHVAAGWITAETDSHYRLDGDLTLRNRDTEVGVRALPSISVNFITKSDIITMLEVTADGAGQLLACWGNPKIVRKRS